MSNVCDEVGRASIAHCVAKKKKLKEEKLEEVTSQVENVKKSVLTIRIITNEKEVVVFNNKCGPNLSESILLCHVKLFYTCIILSFI